MITIYSSDDLEWAVIIVPASIIRRYLSGPVQFDKYLETPLVILSTEDIIIRPSCIYTSQPKKIEMEFYDLLNPISLYLSSASCRKSGEAKLKCANKEMKAEHNKHNMVCNISSFIFQLSLPHLALLL